MEKFIEKERRWLLKRNPLNDPLLNGCEGITFKEEGINQFYTKDGWRYRNTCNHNNYEEEEKYVRLRKVRVGVGINQEVDLEEITEAEYADTYRDENISTVEVRKTRYTFEHNGRKIEIDEFIDNDLTIMEIEDVEMTDTIHLPSWLEDLVLIEITGNSKFDNINLATPIHAAV